jgi:hypothetical protein
MKTKSCLIILLISSALPALAGSCTAVAPATYDQLVTLGATGCALSDLLFSNFTFTGSATGSGTTPTAGQVSYVLDNPSTNTGQRIFRSSTT